MFVDASTQSDAADFGQIFRDIAAYGATRLLQPDGGLRLYNSPNGGVVSPDGVSYVIGQPGTGTQTVASTAMQAGIPPGMLLIIGAVAIYLLARG